MADPSNFNVEAAATVVVSAYHEAISLFMRCKSKRAESNWPGPSKLLEDSLRHSPQAIQAQMKLGGDRFGNDFCVGDIIATNELTKITMTLQYDILKPLYFALEDDSYSIGSTTTDASDSCRIRTLVALGELCQRLAQRHSTDAATSTTILPQRQEVSPITTPTSATPPPSFAPNSGRRMSSVAPEVVRRFSLRGASGNFFSSSVRRGSEMAPEVVDPLVPFPEIPRSNSTKKGPVLDDMSASPSYLPQLAWFRRKSKSSRASEPSPPNGEEIIGTSSYFPQLPSNNRSERPLTETFKSYVAQHSNNRRTNTSLFAAIPESDLSIDDNFSAPGTDSDTTGTWMSGTSGTGISIISAASGRHPRSIAATTSSLLRMPKAENDYLGFCRGAAELQRGDENAFKEQQEWAFGKVPFLMCAYCAFTGRVSYSKVWDMEGIRFRWLFLAKSHVHQKKVSGNVHTYLCMFCVFQGIETSVIQGNDTFLSHIAEHRADDFSDVLLERTRCINFGAATDDQDFDINIIPMSEEETRHQKPFKVLPERLKTAQKQSLEPVAVIGQSPVEAPTEPPERKQAESPEPVSWPYFSS